MAKGEIAGIEQFLLLSQCFQKTSAADTSKCVYRWERETSEENNIVKGKFLVFILYSFKDYGLRNDCLFLAFLARQSTKCKVSFCDRLLSVVSRPSSTFAC